MLSLKFNNVYIKDWYTISSKDEKNGNLNHVDEVINDYYFEEKTFEKAESKMQKVVLNKLLSKNKFDVIVGGDLSNQLGTMNQTLSVYDKSFLGVYNACSSFVEGMIIAANILENNSCKEICVLTSSHLLTSERQFRYPVEYGSLKQKYSTTTITASIGGVLTNQKSKYKITCATIGSVIDYGIKDVYNIGAIMAPGAATTLINHLKNFKKSLDDFDIILTGDLGLLGLELLKNLIVDKVNGSLDKIKDAGSLIYKKEQNKCLGGSGPSVLPLVFFSNIIKNKKYKKILLIGTGALHNPTVVNQKCSIPSIAHAIEIEVE